MISKRRMRRIKMHNAKNIMRRASSKSPHETVLIVCEGEKTEVNYFKDLREFYRLNVANVLVVPSGRGSAPISIVEYAIATAESMFDIDKVFCVFDRDDHPSFKLALTQLKNHKHSLGAKSQPKYHAIVSSPCFEIWPLLHFSYTTKAYSQSGSNSACGNLIADLRSHLPEYLKTAENLFEKLASRTKVAIENAKKLKKDNLQTSSSNPSTDIHMLVQYLLNLTKN